MRLQLSPVPDLHGSALEAGWAQCLRDIWADCLHIHGWGTAKGRAQRQCPLGVGTVGDAWQYKHTSCTSWCSSCEGILTGSSPSWSTPSHLLTLQIRERAGASTPTTGEQILPWTGLWKSQSKDKTLLNILTSSGHTTSHDPIRQWWPELTKERCGRNPYSKGWNWESDDFILGPVDVQWVTDSTDLELRRVISINQSYRFETHQQVHNWSRVVVEISQV